MINIAIIVLGFFFYTSITVLFARMSLGLEDEAKGSFYATLLGGICITIFLYFVGLVSALFPSDIGLEGTLIAITFIVFFMVLLNLVSSLLLSIYTRRLKRLRAFLVGVSVSTVYWVFFSYLMIIGD